MDAAQPKEASQPAKRPRQQGSFAGALIQLIAQRAGCGGAAVAPTPSALAIARWKAKRRNLSPQQLADPRHDRLTMVSVPSDEDFAGLAEALERTPAAAKYRLLRPLSRGAFGSVVLAVQQNSGEQCAIKAMRIGPNHDTKDILREIMHHEKLLHAHVVRFKEVLAAPPYLCIAMEYVSGGDLLDYINAQRSGVAEDEARYIFQQLILAVDYCHRVGVMNRDIKPENTLLVRANGRPPMVKLCDFGYAKGLEDSAPSTRAGTFHYVAPEVLLNQPGYSYDGMKADIWSCGVLLYVMLFVSFPFAEPNNPSSGGGGPLSEAEQMRKMLRRMMAGDFSFPAWKPVSPECEDLISRMLTPDHAARCTIADIKQHPWFQKNLLPGTLDYNDKVLAIKRVLPQSEAEVLAAIEQSRHLPEGSSNSAAYDSFTVESDEDEELAG